MSTLQQASKSSCQEPTSLQGTHFVMGGLLIVKARTGETVYRFSEKTFGDVAPADQVSSTVHVSVHQSTGAALDALVGWLSAAMPTTCCMSCDQAGSPSGPVCMQYWNLSSRHAHESVSLHRQFDPAFSGPTMRRGMLQILIQCDNATGGLLAPIRSFAKSITMKTGL